MTETVAKTEYERGFEDGFRARQRTIAEVNGWIESQALAHPDWLLETFKTLEGEDE